MRKFPALTFALLLPLAACESTAPEEAGITGTYSLQTINGSSLPHTVLEAGSDRFEVTAGAITLNEDLTFTDLLTFRVTEDGIITSRDDVLTGTYAHIGSALTMTPIQSS